MGHHERAGKFKKRWLLDGLNVGPEMAIAIAEITVPAAARPGFENHGERIAVGLFVVRAELLKERPEGGLDRCLDADLLGYGQGQIFQYRCGYSHDCSFSVFSELEMGNDLASARSLMRVSWWRQKRSKVSVHSW